ncbi:MAG: hypothetical protein H6718_15665 [Polyangiaceae bacterium]|nr:hypothetical protein [Polyangiaceae bacterium]MCB9606344.1 hypothetical protein [Polyangiaceae bacterium]
MQPSPEEALARAQEHCFMSGVGDVGEALCAANMAFGLAKMHHVQRELGLPADASFIGATDATVTRNTKRWGQGFGYGGRIQWSGDFAVLDIKSNCCGMIVVAPEQPVDIEALEANAKRLQANPPSLDGHTVDFDLGEGNHFVDVCDVVQTFNGAEADAQQYVIIHTSGHEFRESSPHGPGIYFDASPALAAMLERRETPWGDLHILQGQAAQDWYGTYSWCQDFSLRRRELLARELVGSLKVICNRTHQGLEAINDAILGCYHFSQSDLDSGQRFPLTLAPDLPAYLVRPKPSFQTRILEQTGLYQRAERHGLLERLRGVNLLPHGGGYAYSQYTEVQGVLQDGPDQRRFQLSRPDGAVDAIGDVRGAAYGYRGDEVRQRMLELDLGEIEVETKISYILSRD